MFNQSSARAQAKVLIVGHNCISRRGAVSIIGSVLPDAVPAEASCFREAVDRLAQDDFSAAIFDSDLADLSGPADLQKLRASHPALILAVVSREDDAELVLGYLAAGVNGFIAVCSSQAEIEGAIATISVEPSMCRRPCSSRSWGARGAVTAALRPPSAAGRGLTKRQNEVLKLLSGSSNKEIARRLDLSHHTIKIYVGALLRHFSVRRRRELFAVAMGKQPKHSYGRGLPSSSEARPQLSA